MNLVGREPVQCFHDCLVGQFQSVLHRSAFDHLRGHGTGGNGRTTAEGVEFYVGDDTVVNLDIHFHNIAAFGVAHFADAVGVFHFSQISRMLKMIHHLFTI